MVKIGCGQSGYLTLKLTYLKNEVMELTDFLHAGTQIKSWMKIFGAGMVKNGCGYSDDRILKFTVTEELTEGINWFFACLYMIQTFLGG